MTGKLRDPEHYLRVLSMSKSHRSDRSSGIERCLHTLPGSALKGARDPEQVLRYNFVLRLLLEARFLEVVGFTSEGIAAFARRAEVYRQLKV